MTNPLLTRLASGPLLADGAMGTQLHALGASSTTTFEQLNLTRPELVAQVHRAFIDAGSDIIETNTWGANRIKLASHGLADQVVDINTAGVEIARRTIAASFRPVLLAGSVGPLGTRLAPYGRLTTEAAFEAFREQIATLHAAGVDYILIETISDLAEIEQAVLAARDVAPDLPVTASVTFTRDDRTLMGDSASATAEQLARLKVDIIGLNCSSGPAQLLRLLRQMRQVAPEARFSVMPNAGWPERLDGRLMYPAGPDYFGDYITPLVEAGASVVGGCCGTTPDHIAAMRAALDAAPTLRPLPAEVASTSDDADVDTTGLSDTRLKQTIDRGGFVITVEMNPPKGYAPHKVLAAAQMLAEAGANVLNVADTPLARMRMSAWAVAHLIQQHTGLETILHFPTRGRNILRVQGDLLAAHALDVRNIFVTMGDPVSIGDYPEALNNADITTTGLLKLINEAFNRGRDLNDAQISSPTRFFAGAALTLTPTDADHEIRLLKRKLDNGAGFALGQPAFDVGHAAAFLRQAEETIGQPLALPLLVGVLPLFSTRHAAFLHHEVPGILIPETLQRRIRQAPSARDEGIRIAVELIEELRETINPAGIYIMPPFGRYDIAAEIIEAVKG